MKEKPTCLDYNATTPVDPALAEAMLPFGVETRSAIERARGESSVEALASEMRDRYGPLPTPVLQLLEYARLRLLAEKIRVVSIERDAGVLAFRFDPDSLVDPAKLVNLTKRFPDAQLTPGGVLKLPVAGFDATELLSTVREVLLELSPHA